MSDTFWLFNQTLNHIFYNPFFCLLDWDLFQDFNALLCVVFAIFWLVSRNLLLGFRIWWYVQWLDLIWFGPTWLWFIPGAISASWVLGSVWVWLPEADILDVVMFNEYVRQTLARNHAPCNVYVSEKWEMLCSNAGWCSYPVSGNVCPRDEKVRRTLAWLCKSSATLILWISSWKLLDFLMLLDFFPKFERRSGRLWLSFENPLLATVVLPHSCAQWKMWNVKVKTKKVKTKRWEGQLDFGLAL